MASQPPTILETLMKQVSAMPLWIKQVVYAQLKTELETAMSKATVDAFGTEHMLQLWVPELTREGFTELNAPSGKFSSHLLKVLHLTKFKKNVANITVTNNWSLEQCSILLREAITHNMLTRPPSGIILATIEYLANATRLGEYLVKINRVTSEQLDQALRTQKYIEESMGEKTGIANVMINLGYIRKEDTEGILFLKEESKKPFQGISLPPEARQAVTAPPAQAPIRPNFPQQAASSEVVQAAPNPHLSTQPRGQSPQATQSAPRAVGQPPQQEGEKKRWPFFNK